MKMLIWIQVRHETKNVKTSLEKSKLKKGGRGVFVMKHQLWVVYLNKKIHQYRDYQEY